MTIEKPETVTIDAGVQIGMDTMVEAFAQIRGRTRIGENCRIGSCAIIEDSEIGDEVEIGAFTIVGTSRLERGVHAGPFARLRMENHVGGGGAYRQLRGVEEDAAGRGRESEPPGVSGRLRDRRGGEHRRRARSPAITTASRSTRRGSATGPSSGATRRWWRRSTSARARMWAQGR